jgi:hypothetical protein
MHMHIGAAGQNLDASLEPHDFIPRRAIFLLWLLLAVRIRELKHEGKTRAITPRAR